MDVVFFSFTLWPEIIYIFTYLCMYYLFCACHYLQLCSYMSQALLLTGFGAGVASGDVGRSQAISLPLRLHALSVVAFLLCF